MSDKAQYATIREVDKLEENIKTEINHVTDKVDKVHDCLDGARKDINELKIQNQKQTDDIENLKDNMTKAEESRSRLHNKVDDLKSDISDIKASVKPATTPTPASKSKSEAPILEAVRKRALTVLGVVGTIALILVADAIIKAFRGESGIPGL